MEVRVEDAEFMRALVDLRDRPLPYRVDKEHRVLDHENNIVDESALGTQICA